MSHETVEWLGGLADLAHRRAAQGAVGMDPLSDAEWDLHRCGSRTAWRVWRPRGCGIISLAREPATWSSMTWIGEEKGYLAVHETRLEAMNFVEALLSPPRGR